MGIYKCYIQVYIYTYIYLYVYLNMHLHNHVYVCYTYKCKIPKEIIYKKLITLVACER